MKIEKWKRVEMHFKLVDENGNLLDSTQEDGPVTYIHGMGDILPALEQELEGRGQGEKFEVVLPPEKAYGTWMEEMVQEVPRNQFDDDNLQVGDQFQVNGEGMSLIATIKEIQGDVVTLDANHPLAGRSLKFDLEIVSVQDSTEEERARLSQGGGCGCGDEGDHHHH